MYVKCRRLVWVARVVAVKNVWISLPAAYVVSVSVSLSTSYRTTDAVLTLHRVFTAYMLLFILDSCRLYDEISGMHSK